MANKFAKGKPSHSAWNLLRDSPRVRGALKYQFEQLDLSMKDLEKDLGIPYQSISAYFRGIKPSLTNYQIMSIAEYLGIEISLDIKVLPSVSLKALKTISSNASA